MSYKDITPGIRTAKAVGARVIKSSKGTPGFEVSFEFTEPSTTNVERLNWIGWLSPNAIEYTMNTLVDVLEFNGRDELIDDGSGNLKDPNALNWLKDVSIVINAEEYDGKTRMKIAWVNNIHGSAFQGGSASDMKRELEAVGFTAAFLAAKAKSNLKPKPTEQTPIPAEAVPF